MIEINQNRSIGLISKKKQIHQKKNQSTARQFFIYNQKKMDSYNSPSTKPLYKGTQIVWYIIGILEVLMAFRFVLKLLAANPSAGFSSFIYGITYPFVAPFLSVFKVSRVEGSIFEWTTILAMFVYWLIAIAIIKLFFMSKTVSTSQAAEKLDREE